MPPAMFVFSIGVPGTDIGVAVRDSNPGTSLPSPTVVTNLFVSAAARLAARSAGVLNLGSLLLVGGEVKSKNILPGLVGDDGVAV